jgi:flagellar basal-body rod modification protein FlgD
MQSDFVNKSINKDGKQIVKTMGKDEFLKLLITELTHQDPTNPMQDREFIAQMAQFSSLEQMLNMNTSMTSLLNNMSFQSSFDLLGKNVEIQMNDQVDGEGNFRKVEGTVESIRRTQTDTLVTVDGESYPVSSIVRVK